MNDKTKVPRFAGLEFQVQRVARRRANQQLLRIPWSRFGEAYERYPRWQSLALWGEAIMGIKSRAPQSVFTTLEKQCPGFIRANANWKSAPAFHLLQWAHTHGFSDAEQEGWLDALIFYGVRHPASRAVWTYFEDCEERWSRRRPASLPGFDRWWRLAQRAPLHNGPSCGVVSQAVESFIEWRIFASWLQPLFFGGIGLPQHAVSELESRCPDLAELSEELTASRRATTRAGLWRRITAICEDRVLSRAKREGWAGILIEQVRFHPLYVRTKAYAAWWKQEWGRHPESPYPSLLEWEQAAAEYINLDHALPPDGRCSQRASSHTS